MTKDYIEVRSEDFESIAEHLVKNFPKKKEWKKFFDKKQFEKIFKEHYGGKKNAEGHWIRVEKTPKKTSKKTVKKK